MNSFEARGVWSGLFWMGEFRCPDHGEFRRVTLNGSVQPFITELEARLAAFNAMVIYLNGNMVRYGDKFAMRAEAKQIFHKGRMIPVRHERRKA